MTKKGKPGTSGASTESSQAPDVLASQKVNYREVEKGLRKGLAELKTQLQKIEESQTVTQELLLIEFSV